MRWRSECCCWRSRRLGWFPVLGSLVIAGCAYFLIGSLGVSHWVYDRSDLYRWTWLDRALGDARIGEMALCHSGFDEASAMLKQKFPQSAWRVLDHYDPAIMTEASIRRARKLFPPTAGTIPAKFDRWPLADTSQDVVFGMLAIHELRSDAERAAWFTEARRCLADDGTNHFGRARAGSGELRGVRAGIFAFPLGGFMAKILAGRWFQAG